MRKSGVYDSLVVFVVFCDGVIRSRSYMRQVDPSSYAEITVVIYISEDHKTIHGFSLCSESGGGILQFFVLSKRSIR